MANDNISNYQSKRWQLPNIVRLLWTQSLKNMVRSPLNNPGYDLPPFITLIKKLANPQAVVS